MRAIDVEIPLSFNQSRTILLPLDAAKMEKEMQKKEDDEEKQREHEKRESVARGGSSSSLRRSSAVATPGRLTNATPKFMPKKRGRIGL